MKQRNDKIASGVDSSHIVNDGSGVNVNSANHVNQEVEDFSWADDVHNDAKVVHAVNEKRVPIGFASYKFVHYGNAHHGLEDDQESYLGEAIKAKESTQFSKLQPRSNSSAFQKIDLREGSVVDSEKRLTPRVGMQQLVDAHPMRANFIEAPVSRRMAKIEEPLREVARDEVKMYSPKVKVMVEPEVKRAAPAQEEANKFSQQRIKAKDKQSGRWL